MLEKYQSHNSTIPFTQGERYLNLAELRAKLGNRSRSAIYADLAAGRLPMPIKLGGRIYWAEGDVDAHLRGLRGGAA